MASFMTSSETDTIQRSPLDSTPMTSLDGKAFIRMLDRRMFIMVIMYILNFMDRFNVSASRLRGFQEDLQLSDREYASILSLFYIGYISVQVPSNLFLVRVGRPSMFLPVCMGLWGVLSIATGFTKSFTGVLAIQILMDFVQAPFFPGAIFLLSKWYRRDELSLRTTFFANSTFSNAFASLIASGILDHMDGKLGCAAWRWLFYISGSLTVFFAVVAFFVLPDFPETSTWITDKELRLVRGRLDEDGANEKGDVGSLHTLTLVLKSFKVWWLAVNLALITLSLSFNFFFPTLVREMGFDDTITLLPCAPPWIIATLFIVVARHSDAVDERCYHVVVPLISGIVGFSIALATTNIAARYVSLFLMSQAYAGFFNFYAWISDTFAEDSSQRAAALAFINAFSQLGNIAGSYAWPAEWGPTYRNSYWICVVSNLLSIAMCLCFRGYPGRKR